MNSLLLRTAVSILVFPVMSATAACPSSFEGFFSTFQRSKAFQLQNTRVPISYSYVERCPMHPDCPVVVDKLSRNQLTKLLDPVFPLPAQRAELDLGFKVISQTGTRATIALDKSDSDAYSFTYEFERVGKCWRLSGIGDRSL